MHALKTALIALPLALGLAACGSQKDGETAEDYAAQLGQAQSKQPAQAAAAPVAPAPQVAARADKAIRYRTRYSGAGMDGAPSKLEFFTNGTYRLNEGDQTFEGNFEWLPDGKRLRLDGVQFRPIVVITDNGEIYRVTNEDVPLSDLTPDRKYDFPAK